MSFSSIPSASIQSGKPQTVGLWTLVKNNDDSFNDGTGIGDGVIINRHLYKSNYTWDCFEQTTATPLPNQWYVSAGTAPVGAVGNRQGITPVSATNSTIVKNKYFKFASARILRQIFEVSVDVTNGTAKYCGLIKSGAGVFVYMGFTSGAANQITTFCANDAVTADPSNSTTIAFTYSANSPVFFMIEHDGILNQVRFYAGTTLANLTLVNTASTNVPSTTILLPALQNAGGVGTQTIYNYIETLGLN